MKKLQMISFPKKKLRDKQHKNLKQYLKMNRNTV